MGSTKLIGQLHCLLFIISVLVYLFLAQLDSAHMRAQMQTSAQFKFALYITNDCEQFDKKSFEIFKMFVYASSFV